MKEEVMSPLGGRSSCSRVLVCREQHRRAVHSVRIPANLLCKDCCKLDPRATATLIELSQSLQLTFNHQVVYRYSTEKIRTLFKNELDTPHGFRYRKIERLCTIHVFGIDVCELLPARGILRLGGHQARCANETSLEGQRQALWGDWGWKGKLDELW